MKRSKLKRGALLLTAMLTLASATLAAAASKQELNRDGAAALKKLCAGNSSAASLRDRAVGILVFPSVVKAGFLLAGQMGEGVLFKKGKPVAYYNTVAGSYGFQAGAQVFGYALFFMNKEGLEYLDKSDGWDVGAGPSLVVVDTGMGKSITGTTLTKDVYAFIFNQKGLMGGIGLQGSKITKIDK